MTYLRRRYVTLNDHDLDDILAESVERAWEKYGTYDPAKGTLEQWFSTIIARAA